MSTKRNSAAALASIGILATGWSIGTAHGQTLTKTASGATGSGTTTTPGSSSGTKAGANSGTGAGPSSGTAAGSSSGAAAGTTTAGSATYVGTRQSDRWGSLQVTVTVTNGKITNVTYTSTAGDGKSRSIEARATPTLKSEVVAANSAQVSSVSGATYTSAKYLTSLQSALDQIR